MIATVARRAVYLAKVTTLGKYIFLRDIELNYIAVLE